MSSPSTGEEVQGLMAHSAAPAAFEDFNDGSSTEDGLGNDDLPTLPEVVDKLGVGMAQLKIALTGGAVWMADGAELLLITSATTAVADEWHLSHMQRGSMVTIVFIGILFGNLSSGAMGDTYGRRTPILFSFLGIFSFSIISSFAASFWTLSLWRLLVGFSFGIGQPCQNALLAETTPTAWRITMSACVGCLFTVGEIYSAFLITVDDPTMKHVDWRWLMRMGAIPAGVFGSLSLLSLYQSPAWLDANGRTDEAKAILEMMRKDNRRPDVSVDFRPLAEGPQTRSSLRSKAANQFWTVVGPLYLRSTLIIVYTCFVLNFIFYGCMYAFPQIMQKMALGDSASSQLLIGALWEIPGCMLGIVFGSVLPRKSAIRLYLGCIVTVLLSFALLSPHAEDLGRGGKVSLYFAYYGIKMFPSIGFIVVYLYAAEIFPVQARVTGSSMCIAGGRIAAMIASLVYEALKKATGSHAPFFYILVALGAINFGLIYLLPYETFKTPLTEEGAGAPVTQRRLSMEARLKADSPKSGSPRQGYGATP